MQNLSYFYPVKKVLIAAPISDLFKQWLTENNYQLIDYDANYLSNSQDNDLIDGIITSNKLRLDKFLLEKFVQLKWIARLGSGMEIIDTAYCNENNIFYASSPHGISNAVGEHAIGMLLNLIHKISSSFTEIKNGKWIREPNRGIELENQTVGIIGYGHTGSAFANKLSVFTNQILVYDKYKIGFGNNAIQEVSLEELQLKSDIISFHVPLNDETKYYYSHAFIEAMQKNHIFINTSRGCVADTNAILSGLASGKIKGACLDVLDEEHSIQTILEQPLNIVHDLLKFNVIITPHIAGYSFNAIEKMSAELMSQLGSKI